MLGELVPCGGGESIPIYSPNVIVGRNPHNDVCIPSRIVSGTHCRLDLVEGKWQIRDLDSRNGVSINGERCDKGTLNPDDIVGFAKERYTIVYNPASPAIKRRSAARSLSDSIPQKETIDAPPGRRSAGFDRPSSKGLTSELGTLIPCGGGDPIPLFKSVLVVGRRSSCDIVLQFGTISGRHGRLENREGFWFVQDLGSRNGIRIDSERTDSGWLLPGCVLTIARQRHEVSYEPPPGREPPVIDPFAQSLMEKAGLKNIPRSDPTDEECRERYQL